LNKPDVKLEGSSIGSYAALAGRPADVSGFLIVRLSSIFGSGFMPGLSTADRCGWNNQISQHHWSPAHLSTSNSAIINQHPTAICECFISHV